MLREEVLATWQRLKSNFPTNYQAHLRTIYESVSAISSNPGVIFPVPVKFDLAQIALDARRFSEEKLKEKKALEKKIIDLHNEIWNLKKGDEGDDKL